MHQSDSEENERLIARYKELCALGEKPVTEKDGQELLRIIVTLLERGFRTTEDGKDWLPPATPTA